MENTKSTLVAQQGVTAIGPSVKFTHSHTLQAGILYIGTHQNYSASSSAEHQKTPLPGTHGSFNTTVFASMDKGFIQSPRPGWLICVIGSALGLQSRFQYSSPQKQPQARWNQHTEHQHSISEYLRKEGSLGSHATSFLRKHRNCHASISTNFIRATIW